MQVILLIVHLVIAIALVGVILLQRSEGGALGIGGGGGGMMSARGAANLLTRLTTGLAVAFLATSMTLAIFASNRNADESILDEAPVDAQQGEDDSPQVPIPD